MHALGSQPLKNAAFRGRSQKRARGDCGIGHVHPKTIPMRCLEDFGLQSEASEAGLAGGGWHHIYETGLPEPGRCDYLTWGRLLR